MFGARDVAISPQLPASGFALLADVKEFLGIADAAQDTRLDALIATATQAIEAYCGRILAERTVTEIMDTEDAHTALVLSKFPAVTLTSVAFDDVAQTVGDFRVAKSAATLRRVDGGAFPIGKITVVYTAGFSSVPAVLAEACNRFVAALYNSKGTRIGVTAEAVPDVASVSYGDAGTVRRNGVAVPVEVSSLLAAYVSEFSL